jgi:L-lactate permease
MWQHNYTPIHGSLALSSLVAALPIFVLLFLLGIRRTPAWIAAISGLGTTMLVSFFLYGMPVGRIVAAATYGAAYGWFPIGWIVIWAVFLYRITLDTGKFEAIKHSLRSLTRDPRLQTLLIAFAFGAFLEGAAGFGTPVAVAAAMLAGLGFSPFHAGCVWIHRDSHRHTGWNNWTAADALERGRRAHVRSGFTHRAGLPGSGDGRLGSPG